MKALLPLLALFMAFNVHAVNLAFKFEVTSSGNSMYACNAGLKHKPYQDRVCYERGDTTKSCNPAQCKDGQACNCVCTGGFTLGQSMSGDGEYRLDYFNAKVANWSDNGEAATNVQTMTKTALTNGYRFAVDSADAFSTQLLGLEFFLGSERYGAEYFVDVCFRATQIDYPTSYDVGYLNWSLTRAVTITDLGTSNSPDTHVWDLDETDDIWYTAKTYQDLAGLKVKSLLYCKNKDGGVTINDQTDWTDFNNAQAITFPSKSTREDLKGCFFRYEFKESNRDGLASVRKWKKQKARICTYSSANESAQ
ncbi:hypothetical protein HBN50_09620 [Halobacteriovorax sp. GB3]|uniref:hypothetical protein n=1 Tax=Halobacteriovorax sp. GB3 TaxID=2719615 RepID=UPI00235FC68C|nr:hypothetical protein [Halobacteriovorax sp. GB3]MDD0853356.1 hypothetical protein [Halobacteriovorax sp. GB3]